MSSVNKLKIQRAQAKSKLTRLLNILDTLLYKKGSDASDVQDMVSNIAAKLRDGLIQFERAHNQFAECLESETDETQIETVADTNNQYLTDAEAPVYEALIKIKSFNAEVAEFNKKKETEENILPGLKKSFKRSVEKFRREVAIIASVLEEFDSKTGSQIKEILSLKYHDISGAKESLENAFSDLFDIRADYSEALESIGMDIITAAACLFPDEPFNMEQSSAKFISWGFQADIVLGVQREMLRDEEIKQNKSQALPSEERVLIKLPKEENTTFSDKAQDFATFKREFSQISIISSSVKESRVVQDMIKKDGYLLNTDTSAGNQAREKSAEASKSFKVVSNTERMINDAENFAGEDAEFKSKVEDRNALESYAYSLKNQLSDKEKLGGKLSNYEQSKIEDIINEMIKWLEDNTDASAEDLKAQKKEMEDIVQPIIAKLYQGQGGTPPGGEEEEDSEKDEL